MEVTAGIMRRRIKLRLKSGSHTAYIRADGVLVVEWYDFGENSPYESANLIIFDQHGQRKLVLALGLPTTSEAGSLLDAIGKRFESYFDVRAFADIKKVPYEDKVDFSP
jgi:hypothetical protein